MGAVLYYLIIKPVSLLPFSILYFISDILSWLLHNVIKYRRQVVSDNIIKVFPDKTKEWRDEVIKGFYIHLADIIVESIKGFSLTNKEIKERYQFRNTEILDKYYDNNQDVIIAAGHYANWEWATMAVSLFLRHTCVGIYTPITNKFFERKMKESRGRNGLVLVPKHDVKSYFDARHNSPQAYFFLIDQSPSSPDSAYWSDFMQITTPIQYGLEKYSQKYNIPVIFASVDRLARGKYEVRISNITDQPQEEEYGAIIRKAYKQLEEMILGRPEWWLWSHRRWKHTKN